MCICIYILIPNVKISQFSRGLVANCELVSNTVNCGLVSNRVHSQIESILVVSNRVNSRIESIVFSNRVHSRIESIVISNRFNSRGLGSNCGLVLNRVNRGLVANRLILRSDFPY